MSTMISIGMPVYNEEKFLRYALDSLISQTFQDIEIIICDNASTDKTPDIIQEYIFKTNNIKYYKETTNKGALHNFIKAFKLSSGKYFMWAGGHDTWSTNLIEETVKQLESHPNAAIAFGTTIWINEEHIQSQRESGWSDTRGMHPIERFFTVIWGNVHPILGVMRSDYLKNSRFINTAGTDLIILADMALKGDFLHVAEATCYRRELNIRINESQQDRIKRYRNKDFKLSLGLFNKVFPLFRLPFELTVIILKSRLSSIEKFYLLFASYPTFLIKYLVARKK